MRDILTRITEGKGKKSDITLLEELAELLQDAALCALGSQASNPVLSTLKHFRKEYEAHINRRQCSAGVCKIGPAKVK